MKIAVSGSTGLLGRAVVAQLRQTQHLIVRMVRSPVSSIGETNAINWLPSQGTIQTNKLNGVDAVVHLAGENIVGRWTSAKKIRIRDSRVMGTRTLADALARLERGPKVLICASAIGYYGDRGDEELDESSANGEGFFADVCKQWEDVSRVAEQAGVRVVNLRIGMVLAREGGALAKMLPAFKFGVGGRIGSGRQYMSWIHIRDLVRVVEFALETPTMSGPVNAVAPQPVTNAVFTKTLGKAMDRSTPFPLPAFAAKLLFGEMAKEALLASVRAVPKKLLDAGFTFKYPQLDMALSAALKST